MTRRLAKPGTRVLIDPPQDSAFRGTTGTIVRVLDNFTGTVLVRLDGPDKWAGAGLPFGPGELKPLPA
jgi:hypothetical protein